VKEMTASILRRVGTTVSTVGNFNNRTGVPLSILQMNRTVAYAVIEVGMSISGEIRALMPMVRPHVAGVLNVAPVHMENFANLEAIRDAKAEIFTHLEDKAVAVLSADDPLVRTMNPGPEIRKRFFGMSPSADVRVGEARETAIEGQEFDLFCREHKLPVRLAALGEHNRLNAAAAAALAMAAGASVTAIAEGLAAYRPGMMRSELLKLSDGSLLFDDCYNASPRAFEEALKTLIAVPQAGRRIVAMGDMLELGTDSVEYHRKVGERAAELGVEVFFGFGPLTAHAVEAFQKHAPTRTFRQFASIDDLFRDLVKIHKPDDIILVKGSRGMRMERVAERLKVQFPPLQR
jgi:UDP-N-acetylmuramoyl-tripeptide--D-alanyl-D-alanine ligase